MRSAGTALRRAAAAPRVATESRAATPRRCREALLPGAAPRVATSVSPQPRVAVCDGPSRRKPRVAQSIAQLKVRKNAQVSVAQFGGKVWPMLALKEHSMNSFEQLLCDTQVITLVLE